MRDGVDLGDALSVIDDALAELDGYAQQETDGVWLEDLVERTAPLIRDWNVDACWRWTDWPDRKSVMPDAPDVDVGIDLVARRRDDGAWIAIQSKSRKLNEQGEGAPVTSAEMDKFLAASADRSVWGERWLAVNGAVSMGGHSPGKALMSGVMPKLVNVAADLQAQRAAAPRAEADDACPHCAVPGPPRDRDEPPPQQTRSCMQREAVEKAAGLLREHELTVEDGIPRGEARGRIVLPCGTGKTRIALRITEKLTNPGELSVVLCPSIALVAQIRREFMQHAAVPLRSMAVCSDESVADDDERVANVDDPTIDRGLASTEALKGCPVTTDPEEIAAWISRRRDGAFGDAVSVIFGTYQSARRISEAVSQSGAADAFKVLICDEAHRTAGVRRRKRGTAAEERLREFTLCHDREAFPATYRVYQTATPRIYGDAASGRAGRSADLCRPRHG